MTLHTDVARKLIDRVETTGSRIVVNWRDGHESRFPAIWLRDNCTCAECGTSLTGFKFLRVVDIPPEISAETANLAANGTMVVEWRPGGHHSSYDPAWLRAHCLSDVERDRRRFATRSWGPEIAGTLPRADFATVCSDDKARLALLEQVLRSGFTVLEGVPAAAEHTDRVLSLFGNRREGSYGLYDMDTKSAEEVGYHGDTGAAQEPHTDESYRTATAAITIFHMIKADEDGGVTKLVDGFRIGEHLARQHPEAYAALTTIPQRFVRVQGDRHVSALDAPVLSVDRSGVLSGVRYLERSAGPMNLPEDQIDACYDALRLFQTYLFDARNQLRFTVSPGEALVFNNQRILHGRTGFDRARSKRHLRHASTDLDAFYATLRRLYHRQGREEAFWSFPAGAGL